MDTAHKLAQFEDRTRQAANAILPHASLSVVERRRDLFKIRIGFGKKTFIDIFYNPDGNPERSTLALLRAQQAAPLQSLSPILLHAGIQRCQSLRGFA